MAASLLAATYLYGGKVKRKITAGISSLALLIGVLSAASPANAAVIKLPLSDWPACSAVPTSLYCVESVVVTSASGARTTLQYVVSGQAPKAEAEPTGDVFAPMARIEDGKVKDNAWWSPTYQREVLINPAKQLVDLSSLLGTPNHPEQGAKYDPATKKYDINKSEESYSYLTDCWDPATSTYVKKIFRECYKGSIGFLLNNELRFFWFHATPAEAAGAMAQFQRSTFIDLSKMAETQTRPTINSTYNAATGTFSATEPLSIPNWLAKGAQENGWIIVGQPKNVPITKTEPDVDTSTVTTDISPTNADAIGSSVEAGKALGGRWTHSNWAGLGLNSLGYDGIYIKSAALGEYQRSWLMADVLPVVNDKDNKTFLAAQPGNTKFAINLDLDLTVSIKLRIGEMIPGVTFAIATGVTLNNQKTNDYNTLTLTGSPVTVPLAAKTADCKGEDGVAKANVRQFQLITLSQNDDQSGFGVPGTTGNMFVGSNGVCELSTPVWNDEDKTFTWRVAAPHFAPDGVTVNRGFYKAVIPAADAALLWGLSNPNDAATALDISLITEESGVTNAFTKVISVKNGNIIIDIAGFEYSRPKIKIGIKANYKPTKNAAKRTTITCIQGKAQKKITAVKPKCPTGYKKK
ncbi:MAG: hypothetical protein RLY76_936 [Actinomycetota bacterium]|jgi:hypothetical protein